MSEIRSDIPPPDASLMRRTPLHGLHLELGGRMVPFAGWEMPVQYAQGILEEHRHTRAQAGLFDVSHMGQIRLLGQDAARALESLVPGDIQGLKPGRMRYTLLTNDRGGIIDDLMVTRRAEGLFLVVNASGRERDMTHMRDGLGAAHEVRLLEDRALLALQGPAAAGVLDRHAPGSARLRFMEAAEMAVAGIPCSVSRSGYTGEDGFEISVPADRADDLARRLLAEPEVRPIGLGARDSLRLEAGLCLYGHDIDETTTPVEANLTWTIGKRRKMERGFPGDAVILEQLFEGATRRRVGIRPEGRAPVREGAPILDAGGAEIGRVTSGTFGPTVNAPVAMGYVPPSLAEDGTWHQLELRGRKVGAVVAPLPFAPHRYVRSGQKGEG